MARTAVVKSLAPGNYPTAGVVVTWAAADVVNKNVFNMGSKDLLLVRNTDSSSHTVTITSTADPQGRLGDITDTIEAGTMRVYGTFVRTVGNGWAQSNGDLNFEANSALVEFAVVTQAG